MPCVPRIGRGEGDQMSDRHSRALDKLAAALGPAFQNGDVELAKATIVSCCHATRRVRAGKDASGGYLHEDEPDYTIRLAAAVKIIEWTIGKPIARTINAEIPTGGAGNGGDSTGRDLLDLLLAAPDAAVDIVAKLQQAAAKAKQAEPVEIVVSPENPKNPAPPESSSEGSTR